MKTLTRDEVVNFFHRQRTEDLSAALYAVYLLGMGERARLRGELTEEQRRAHAEANQRQHDIAVQRQKNRAADLHARYDGLLEAVAKRNGTTQAAMREAACVPGHSDASGAVREAAFILREGVKPRLVWSSIQELLNRDRSSLILAVKRQERYNAERPGLREELLALLGPAAEAKRGVA